MRKKILYQSGVASQDEKTNSRVFVEHNGLTRHSVGSTSRGFTLLEMLVSLGLFAIVMLTVTGAYFTLIGLDRQARASNQVVNNIAFAVDAMARGIRAGTNFQCLNGSPDANGNSTNGTCTQFAYTDANLTSSSNPNGETVVYILKSNGTIGECENSLGNTTCLSSNASSITDPAITVSELAFYVQGAGSTANSQQAEALFVIKGSMPSDSSGHVASFVIEEAATQRLIDL